MISIWLPCNKDIRNQGLTYSEPTGRYEIVDDGPFGKCLHTTSAGSIDTLVKSSDGWNIVSGCGFGAWLKFDLTEMRYASAYTYNATNNVIHNCILGFNSYGGFSLDLTSNNINNDGAFNSISIVPHIRFGTSTNPVAKAVTFNEWHHYYAQYNNVRKTIEYFYDGTLFSSGSAANVPVSAFYQTFRVNQAQVWGGNAPGKSLPYYVSDVRVYDHVLKDWEIKKLYNSCSYEMEAGLHLKETTNLGGSSITYKGKNYGQEYNASSWGGDAGKVKMFKDGGYANLPYKEYHRTASGTGGVYLAQTKDITIESGKTYTMSIYVKASRNFNDSHYSFNINGVIPGDSNHYITYGKNVPFTTEWNRLYRTFTATTAETGNFDEMSIVYDDRAIDYYVYYSGFQLEAGDQLSPFTYSHRDETFTDSSGLNNGVIPYNITQSGSSLYFNGVDSAIEIPLHKYISGGTWSINLWFYRPNGEFSTKGYESFFGGPNGFELDSKNGTGTTPCVYIISAFGSGSKVYEFDKWNMVTMTRTESGTKYYLNGELFRSNSAAGTMPAGSYFIGAWVSRTQQNFKGYMKRFSVYQKELSAEDVMNLYLHGE